LPEGDVRSMDFGSGGGSDAKAWKDIWGSGQGIGAVDKLVPVAELVDRLGREYSDAKAALCG
jgi:nitronate monooxygenase